MSLNQITPSVTALSLGTLLTIQQLDTEQQQNNWKALQAGAETARATAQGLADSTMQAVEKDSEAMENNAYGQIGQAGTQVGGELGSVGVAGYKFNSSIKTAEAGLERANEWVGAFKSDPAKAVVANGNAAGAFDRQKLKDLDFNSDPKAGDKALLQHPQKLADENQKVFDDKKDAADKNRAEKKKDLDRLHDQKDQLQGSWSRRFQSASYLMQGTFQLEAAKQRADQAGFEALKQNAQYANQTIETVNGSMGQNAQNWASNQRDVVQIQASIAQANRI